MPDSSKTKTLWDLKPLLPNENPKTIQAKIDEVNQKCQDFDTKWGKEQEMFSNPKLLKQALDDLEGIFSTTETANYLAEYFALKSSLDESDPRVKAWQTKIEDATRDNVLVVQRFINRITRIPVELQKTLLNNNDLKEYKRFLEDLFEMGKHTLSDDEEKIMFLNQNISYGNWIRMTSEFLALEDAKVLTEDGKKERKDFNTLFSLITSQNKEVRASSAAQITEILSDYAKVAEAEVNSVLEYKKIYDLLRNYKTPDESFSISNKVSMETIEALIAEVTAGNKIVHEYYEFRAKLFGLEKINYYERNIDFGEFSREFGFEEAVKIVHDTLTKLNPLFGEILENHLYNGQIDVYPKKGKTGGAFASHTGKNKPNYVLLNFDKKITDVFTFAHEMGHSINHELINKEQKALYQGQGECIAEIASIFFEGFAVDNMAKKLDDEERLALLVREMDEAVGSVFRQIACYKFECDLHKHYREKGFLSYQNIGDLFVKNMYEYCGPSVVMNKGSEYWWIYWSHIRSFFYVYSYAFGYLVSKNLQNMVKQDRKNIQKVITLLSTGSSKTPEEILREMGIDITDRRFWQKGVEEIGKTLEKTIELAKKLGKI